MLWPSFKTSVSGKWVLAGEHSVLRGATAIALPQREVELSLSFQPGESTGREYRLQVTPLTARDLIHELLVSIAEAWEGENHVFQNPSGNLTIESSIPVGAGLGSSAALCVALTRWVADPLMLSSEKLVEFATQLEHRFHGRSSGMDVAVIAAEEPISFSLEKGAQSVGIKKLPRFTFHDTGLRCRTSECVVRVEKFREEKPELAMEVDEKMSQVSRLAIEGLILFDSGKKEPGLELLVRAIKQAQECFYIWELVPGAAKRLEEDLLRQGALAVKLTGAGGGGMMVALWNP